MFEIPLMGKIIIGIVTVMLTIGIYGVVAEVGREKYQLKFFVSSQYAMFSVALIAVLISMMMAESDINNLYWGGGVAALMSVAAVANNVQQSNVVFGIFYSLMQASVSVFSILVVAGLFLAVLAGAELTGDKTNKKFKA